MRPLETAEIIHKREMRRKRIIGISIIALLVLSTAGFALNGLGTGIGGNNNQEVPEGEAFYNGQYWVYTSSGQQFYFTHKKEEANFDASGIQKSFADFAGKKLYIDSENVQALNEISVNLGRFANDAQEACYGGCERDLPEKDCSENLISFKDSQVESIREQEKCVFIEGNLKALDAFLYRALGLN